MFISPRVHECIWATKERKRYFFQYEMPNKMEKNLVLQAERRGSLSRWESIGLASGKDAAIKLTHSKGHNLTPLCQCISTEVLDSWNYTLPLLQNCNRQVREEWRQREGERNIRIIKNIQHRHYWSEQLCRRGTSLKIYSLIHLLNRYRCLRFCFSDSKTYSCRSHRERVNGFILSSAEECEGLWWWHETEHLQLNMLCLHIDPR